MLECKNCATAFEGNYCHNCGQKYYTAKDKTVKSIVNEVFHFLTHFEGTFFTTLKAILFKPGKLTLDYTYGNRKKYFKPVSFYFLIVVICLLFPIFKGLNMEMKYYQNSTLLFDKQIEKQIENKMVAHAISLENLTYKFESKSKITSKVCLFLFIPISVLLLFILFPKKNKLLFDRVILATEINIFYLLVLYLIFPIIFSGIAYFISTFFSFNSIDLEYVVIIFLYSVFTFYCISIFKKIYNEKWL